MFAADGIFVMFPGNAYFCLLMSVDLLLLVYMEFFDECIW